MTAETTFVSNAGGQGRMCVLWIITDMASQTSTTTIPHNIVAMSGLRLAHVATGALLAQHRVRNAVPQGLQIGRALWLD